MNARTPPCTVGTDGDGMISSTGDTWTFTPDSDLAAEIMIDLPDTDFLYFGWWLKEPAESDGAYAFRTFSGGTVPFAVGGKFTSGHTGGAAWHGVVSRPGGGPVCDEGFHRWGAQRRHGGRVHRGGHAGGEFRGRRYCRERTSSTSVEA